MIGLVELPPGYFPGKLDQPSPDVILSRESPVSRKDYVVRRGITWEFRVSGGAGGALVGATVYFTNPRGRFRHPIRRIRQGDPHPAAGRSEAHRPRERRR